MIDANQARLLVDRYLDAQDLSDCGPLMVCSTIEMPFGWIFHFNTVEFIRTGLLGAALGGNGPIVVRRDTGEIFQSYATDRLEDLAAFHAEAYWKAQKNKA